VVVSIATSSTGLLLLVAYQIKWGAFDLLDVCSLLFILLGVQ
jgi:hypothetical protein